ncbi:MAG: sensor histidine kinase [Planctomycetia bacterium]|nr:sensor histidine kinase [Planctomycetia bacterium]
MSLLHVSAPVRPLRLFLSVLALVFIVEATVMLSLPWILPADSTPQLEALVDACGLTLVLAPLLWWLVIRPLQRLAALRSLLVSQLLAAQETERRRMAHDLHDGLGQTLTTLTVGLRTLEEAPSLETVKMYARELRRIGGEAHEEIRRLARGLRPAVLDDLGLAAALERYVADFRTAHGVDASFTCNCPLESRLPAEVETTLYRIAQEATMNALRHGRAGRIEVALECGAKSAELRVGDDGRGFDAGEVLRRPAAQGPFGLLSMRERAEQLHGEATIVSTIGVGTQVSVVVPLRDSNHD